MSVLSLRRLRLGGLAVRVRLPRRAPVLVLALAGVLVLLGGGWLWFRDSSFVAIKRVQITGVSGPDVRPIETALRSAALTMTTLDVDMGQLRTAVRPYPDVRTLSITTQFPHGVVIHVSEQVPVAAVSVSGHAIAVAGDGTLLETRSASSLPTIPLRVPPGGTHLSEPGARAALRALADAPYALLGHIRQATSSAQHGVVVSLHSGPQLYFGDTTDLKAKWEAVVAVLGSGGSRGAQYIDVSDPQRPAAGASISTSGATPPGGASSASSGG